MAAIWWRRARRSKKVSSAGAGAGHGYGARQPMPIFGSSISSTGGTTTTTSGTTGTRTTMTTLSTSANTVMRDEEEDSAMGRQEVVRTRRHLRGLVEEFCAGADDGGNASASSTVPDRWLSELNVACWLLRPAAEAEPGHQHQHQHQHQAWILVQREMQTWILALQVIRTSVRRCFSGLYSNDEAGPPPAVSEFVKFLKATLLKMLTFVDAVVALAGPLLNNNNNNGGGGATSASSQQQHVLPAASTCSSSSSVVVPVVVEAAEKVRALLDVRHALSAASEQIIMAFSSSPYDVQLVADDIGGLLSAQLGKLDQAIRDTFDHIRTAVDDDNNNPSAAAPAAHTTTTAEQLVQLQSSPNHDIHNIARSVVNCVNIFLSTEPLMLPVNYARHQGQGQGQGDTYSLTTLAVGVLGYLEEELVRVSQQSFPDQSLRFIFLINNSNFIQHHINTSWPPHLHDYMYRYFSLRITDTIYTYIQSYVQVTWAPVLKCLDSPKPSCFTRSSSPLPKFESMFRTTYAAQKLWKVPDSELRKRLRKAVVEEVVLGFREYLEDNSNRITPGVTLTPQEVEEMLQELFEG